jgi:putative sigma-54 modulation protein
MPGHQFEKNEVFINYIRLFLITECPYVIYQQHGKTYQEAIMQIQIQARDFPLTEALIDYVERSINFALSSRFGQLKRIEVRLSDINGPRGGKDKRCQILIGLPRLRNIVIEDTQTDLYVAIDRAVERAGRTLNRRLKQQYFKNRKLFVSHKHNPVVAE